MSPMSPSARLEMKATSWSVQAPSVVASPSQVADLTILFLRVMPLISVSSKRAGIIAAISSEDNAVPSHQDVFDAVPGGFRLRSHVLTEHPVFEAAGSADAHHWAFTFEPVGQSPSQASDRCGG